MTHIDVCHQLECLVLSKFGCIRRISKPGDVFCIVDKVAVRIIRVCSYCRHDRELSVPFAPFLAVLDYRSGNVGLSSLSEGNGFLAFEFVADDWKSGLGHLDCTFGLCATFGCCKDVVAGEVIIVSSVNLECLGREV